MKNLNNPENTITNQPFFETIFIKHKKLLYALPVVLIAIILGIYFTGNSSKDQNKPEESNVDVTLPGAKTKELSDDKRDVLSDFSELSEENQKAQNKSDQINIESVNTNETASNNESIPVDNTYQDENDKKVVDKVNKMLKEMEGQKKKNASYTVQNTPKTISQHKEVDYEEKNNTESSFNNFFNQKSTNITTKQEKVQLQSDPLIYASIKGDHLRLRNNSRVTLILPKETIINGKAYKKNTLIYAQATFSGNRVNLSINNINQVPLNIKAYDAEDGNLGLQVERSIIAETGSEVVKDGADEIDVNGVPLGNTIKSLFKKKQQEPKIDLLNNQRLILKIVQ